MKINFYFFSEDTVTTAFSLLLITYCIFQQLSIKHIFYIVPFFTIIILLIMPPSKKSKVTVTFKLVGAIHVSQTFLVSSSIHTFPFYYVYFVLYHSYVDIICIRHVLYFMLQVSFEGIQDALTNLHSDLRHIREKVYMYIIFIFSF